MWPIIWMAETDGPEVLGQLEALENQAWDFVSGAVVAWGATIYGGVVWFFGPGNWAPGNGGQWGGKDDLPDDFDMDDGDGGSLGFDYTTWYDQGDDSGGGPPPA